MADFSEREIGLLHRVTEPALRMSLALIRQAVAGIWADDAPRLIQDYTDHGIRHCERLAGLVAKLLDANGGPTLSPQETYLLLAGIYLHDIGMQCDVSSNFPDIKELAVKLGARFDVSFRASTSNRYSSEEQKAVRKNHQYLSAAWIQKAYLEENPVLSRAIRSVPEDLVTDLMDVCKFHTKLSITDCPVAFKYNPLARKQLVAALLRFADELDIDQNRVSRIEVIRSFSIDPQNAVFWWLHGRTLVSIAENVITITISLHSDDLQQYGEIVRSVFIDEFQSKNEPTIRVLVQNRIPLVISGDSKVVENGFLPHLPPEIVDALQAIRQLNSAIAMQQARVSPDDKKGVLKRLDIVAPLLWDARILWVDDDPAHIGNERALLERLGVHVRAVTTSAEAEKELRENIYLLVITDLKREGKDTEGLEFVNRTVASRTNRWTIAYVGTNQEGKPRPAHLFAITDRPDHLMHYVCDIAERERL